MKAHRGRVARGVHKKRANSHLLISSSIRAALLAGAAAGAITPLAAIAQTTTTSTTAQNAKDAKKAKSDKTQDQAATPATTGNEIVVTGQRAALENAAQMKRNSDTISDSIVLDEAGKVPSTSLLEVLERSPGVTMNRIRAGDQGSPDGYTFEGSGIQVRGLTGTKTLLNGREIFSASGGTGLSYSDIGPELLRTVTIYKASRADLIAGGIAGTVDLRTYMPFDVKGTQVSGSISGSYGDFSDSITPSASLRASTRFDTGIGEFGILVDAAYSKIKSYDSNILVQPYFASVYNGDRVYAPGGFSETDDQFERTRKGLYVAAQWQPTPELQIYHTTFISKWDSNRDTQLVILSQPAVGAADGSTFDNGVFQSGGIINATSPGNGIVPNSNASYTPSHSKTSDFSTGFKYNSGAFHLDGSYQHTVANSGSSKYSLTLGNAAVTQVNMSNLNTPRPDIAFATPFEPDPATAQASNVAWLTMPHEGHQDTLTLDASYDLGDGFFRKVAVGGRYANRKETDDFVGTWWSPTGRGWNGVPRANAGSAPEGDFQLEQFSDFFKGDLQPVGQFYVPTSQVLRGDQFDRVMNTYAACGPDLYYQCSNPASSTYLYGNPADPSFGLQPSHVVTRPKTAAIYALLGFKNESATPMLNFSGNIGVRWVHYDVNSQGNYIFAGNTTFYRNAQDAQKSLAAIGGIDNLSAWQDAHPGQDLPYTYTSNNYAADRTGGLVKDYFLPSFNIKFEPQDGFIIRYALTETMTPPSYQDIRAQGTASVQTSPNPYAPADGSSGLPGIFNGYGLTTGNPFLEPQLSLNNDISIEWYPHRGTSVYLSLFHKRVKHQLIFNNFGAAAGQFFAPADQPTSTPADGGAAVFIPGNVAGKQNVNADQNTYIKGASLGGRTYFDMLPGLLSGFGIDANVTYIDGNSPDALALDMNGDPLHVPLIGLSKWAYSATLLYDKNKISARVSWTWRDRYLATTSDSSTSGTYTDPQTQQDITYGLPVYAAASGRLDASIGYEFSDHLNMRLNVANITNTDQRTEMEILPNRYVQRGVFVTDRRVSLNLGFSF
ncbi:TonB-dependent receptor [Stakelama marina]|uniref:TonB-dependent receptor n=1 Tax=Stakelama marina TaxID=2826939 RepID=A0A8T4ICP9_9SPHN|nr:TonB-dependent receptor [Stakelama marina]MBR0552808.1 TonB-dependent receptor [Stakelama marina]